MDLWLGCGDRGIPRHDHHHRALLDFPGRDLDDGDRGPFDPGRLLDERHDRHLRPHPRESEADAARTFGAGHEQGREPDLEPYDHDLGSDVFDGDRTVYLWRSRPSWI